MAKLSSFASLLRAFQFITLTCVQALQHDERDTTLRRDGNAIAPGIQLRILPVGDSITYGYRSSDGNGYRLDLLNDLTSAGSQVIYIGSVNSGSMQNNENEGHSGYTINQIAGAIRTTLYQQPNVVLLHAGTNDMNNNTPTDPYDSAPERLGDLIDEILCICSNTTLIVAQIIESSNSGTSDRIKTYNAAIPGVVHSRAQKGFKVMTVNMSSIGVNGSELADGLHPNDQGYDNMASFWFKGLQQASDKGWITAPDPGSSAAHPEKCNSGQFWYPANSGNQIATGIGGGDVRFADLDGDGLDDYIVVNETTGALVGYLNGGATPANSQGWLWFPQNGGNEIATGIGSNGSMIHLADIDGDGKADYLSVDPVTGAVVCYLNGGRDSSANGGWRWSPKGQIASGIGVGAGVRFADINCDGRADYIWMDENGAATVYINEVFISPQNWVALNNGRPVATGVGATREQIQFADINGDGCADYLWVHSANGSVDMWRNNMDTDALPDWTPQGTIATGIGFSGQDIQFARLDHTERAAYVAVTPSSGAVTAYLNGCQNPAPAVCGTPPLPAQSN